MEHQMGSSLFVKYTIQQFLPLIKDQLDEELHQLILTLSMTISKSGLKLENLKEILTDSRLTYISAQLLAISLCADLNKEMRQLGIDGVNYLESEKQLESRTLCLKATLTKRILKLIKKMD